MGFSHVLLGAGEIPAQPSIRRIGIADLRDALVKGTRDFYVMPTHAMFLCIIYPIVGLVIACLAFGYSILPLVFPLASGFALVGPIAALGLYELSRRREVNLNVSATHALDVVRSSSIGAIVTLAILLFTIFLIWIAVANAIYVANFGYAPPQSTYDFVQDVLTTRAGWNLILVGNGVGFLFAVLVFAISVVSFPFLLDRDVGAAVAVLTSVRAVLKNPITMSMWALIVGILLVIGSLPFFLGLTIVMPILGHSTWHLYRKVVDPKSSSPPTFPPQTRERRYAADFPAAIFPWAR
jgi:uncharacterized membrane protein